MSDLISRLREAGKWRDAEACFTAADEIIRLRAELATEHKRQSAMRTLIASLEGQLMHYRSKQAEADEAVRTLDSERAANATLTAELAECREDAERYRHVRTNPAMLLHLSNKAFDDAIDAARKGEGE